MHHLRKVLLDLLSKYIWLICIAVAVLLLITVLVLIIQWFRVLQRRKYPKTVDLSPDARRSIELARQSIEFGLIKGLCNEFGNTAPEDMSSVLPYITSAYSFRNGGQYISVDALSAFLHNIPFVFLQGSDSVGGESVLPLKVSESGERCFYLEGLSITYRRDDFQYTIKYNIRFLLEKAGRPIGDVLDFEIMV